MMIPRGGQNLVITRTHMSAHAHARRPTRLVRSRIQVDILYSGTSPAGNNACAWTLAARDSVCSVQSILGGGASLPSRRRVSLQSRSTRVRNVLGYASFLIVLRTQRISRSLSLIPQRIPASLAVVSAAAGPAPHSHPARVCSVLHPPSHAGQGILWESLAVGRGVASARSTDAGRRRRPARWTRLYASNRLRSRSSPPDEDRGRSSPPNKFWLSSCK